MNERNDKLKSEEIFLDVDDSHKTLRISHIVTGIWFVQHESFNWKRFVTFLNFFLVCRTHGKWDFPSSTFPRRWSSEIRCPPTKYFHKLSRWKSSHTSKVAKLDQIKLFFTQFSSSLEFDWILFGKLKLKKEKKNVFRVGKFIHRWTVKKC